MKELTEDFDNRRFCKKHNQYHGPLYVCASYSDELKTDIKKQSQKWVNQLNDPEWIKQQLDNGVPPIAIDIQRIFAGLEDNQENNLFPD